MICIVVSNVFTYALDVCKESFTEQVHVDSIAAKDVVPPLTWYSFQKCKASIVFMSSPKKKKVL